MKVYIVKCSCKTGDKTVFRCYLLRNFTIKTIPQRRLIRVLSFNPGGWSHKKISKKLLINYILSSELAINLNEFVFDDDIKISFLDIQKQIKELGRERLAFLYSIEI